MSTNGTQLYKLLKTWTSLEIEIKANDKKNYYNKMETSKMTDSFNKLEIRLEQLTKLVSKKQEKVIDKMIIDNHEFQRLFKISPGTAANLREQGLIAYSQIKNKIVYRIEDINTLLDNNYRSIKKQ